MKYKLILVIVNQGFSEKVMDAARDVGARGGTIVHARGTGSKLMEQKYGIIITPNKEMIYIVVADDIADKVLSAIYKEAGLATDGRGIAFALPVDDVVGIKVPKDEEEAK